MKEYFKLLEKAMMHSSVTQKDLGHIKSDDALALIESGWSIASLMYSYVVLAPPHGVYSEHKVFSWS